MREQISERASQIGAILVLEAVDRADHGTSIGSDSLDRQTLQGEWARGLDGGGAAWAKRVSTLDGSVASGADLERAPVGELMEGEGRESTQEIEHALVSKNGWQRLRRKHDEASRGRLRDHGAPGVRSGERGVLLGWQGLPHGARLEVSAGLSLLEELGVWAPGGRAVSGEGEASLVQARSSQTGSRRLRENATTARSTMDITPRAAKGSQI